jgi:hypothetical protein
MRGFFRDRTLIVRSLVMTVDFRSVVLSKGEEAELVENVRPSRRSPRMILVAVIFAVVSALCIVRWIWG